MYKTKKTAKFLSCLLVLMMILTIAPVSVMAATPWTVDTVKAKLTEWFGGNDSPINPGCPEIVNALMPSIIVTNVSDDATLKTELAKVSSLSLTNKNISTLKGFEFLTGLVSLDVSNNDIREVTSLASLSDLSSLNISNNALTSLDIYTAFSGTKINTLTVSGNALTTITCANAFANLLTLTANDNKYPMSITSLTNLSNLTDLNLTNNLVDGTKMTSLAGLPLNLRRLNITGQKIATAAIKTIKDGNANLTITGVDSQATYSVTGYNQSYGTVAAPQTTYHNLQVTADGTTLTDCQVKSSVPYYATVTYTRNGNAINTITITPLVTGYIDLQLCDSAGNVIKTLQSSIYISRNPITSVSIIGAVTSIPLGTSMTLLAAVTPYMPTPAVSWESSNQAVLTINSAGTITAVGYGYSTITVRTTDGSSKSATALISVIRPVDYITLSQTSLTMYTNQETKLTATCAPDTATNKTVTWDSSNPGTVSVNYLGELTALRAGTTTVTATTTDGTNRKASCIVTVSSTPLTVTILPRELSMNTGENTTLTATVTPSIVENKAVTWTSSNNMVAVVDSTGKIFALREGSAMITATSKEDPKKAAYCMLTVKDRNKPVVPTYDVTLNRDTASIQYGNRYRLKAYFDGELASYGDVRWTSSNARIARVTSYGNVYGDDCGKATIYARDPQTNAVLAKCTVTIKPRTGEINLSKYGSSAIKVDYDETEGSTYYRIYYKEGLYGTYQRAATTTNLSTVRYGLTRGQTYYFKMRSYTTVGGQNIYSNYSKTAKLTLR